MTNIALNVACTATEDVRDLMKSREFAACDAFENICAARELAGRLIPGSLASPEAILAVQARTSASVFLFREGETATGFMAFFALSDHGERAVQAGEFSGAAPQPHWTAPFSPDCRAGYIWAFGGVTKRAAFSVIRTWRALRAQLTAHLTVYARAATPQGRALMRPMGYQPFGSERSDWFSSPPTVESTQEFVQ